MGRASKRQARAKQELAELSSGVPPDRPVEEEAQEGIQEEEEEDEVPATVKGAGAFALLNAGAEDADEAEGESGGDEEEAAESAAVKVRPPFFIGKTLYPMLMPRRATDQVKVQEEKEEEEASRSDLDSRFTRRFGVCIGNSARIQHRWREAEEVGQGGG